MLRAAQLSVVPVTAAVGQGPRESWGCCACGWGLLLLLGQRWAAGGRHQRASRAVLPAPAYQFSIMKIKGSLFPLCQQGKCLLCK